MAAASLEHEAHAPLLKHHPGREASSPSWPMLGSQHDLVSQTPRWRIALAAVTALSVAALATSGRQHSALSPSSQATGLDQVPDPDPAADSSFDELIVSTKYSTLIGEGYNLDALGTLVPVSNEVVISLPESDDVMWSVDGELITERPQSSIRVTFDDIGKHSIDVFDSTGEQRTFDINAKIVRRELRSLDDEDRDRFFNAMQEVYQMDQDEGSAKYGPGFSSANELIRIHLYGAADRACDHWHDDMGMVNHHVGVTWKLEQSLRSIDPSTASHYWNFAADNGDPWDSTIIFDDDWFGENSPSHPDHIVEHGRWAYTAVLTDAREYSRVTNPYGLLRSPWNTNPVPYLMRSNFTAGLYADGNRNYPTCHAFASIVGESLGEMMFQLNGPLHGAVHIMIGGHWGLSDKLTSIGAELQFGSDTFLLLSKFLWRQGLIQVPEYCSSDTAPHNCRPKCLTEVIDSFDDAYEVFEAFGLTNVTNFFPLMLSAADRLDLSTRDILDDLCSIGYPGEMFSSSAPQDPIFWAVHGNAERLLQYARILKERGEVDFDETWEYSHGGGSVEIPAPSDTDRVCDWENVKANGLPTCNAGTCEGHKVDDLLPFKDLTKEQTSLYSNREFYGILHPSADIMPYIYDSLTTWKGCKDDSLEAEIQVVKDSSSGGGPDAGGMDEPVPGSAPPPPSSFVLS